MSPVIPLFGIDSLVDPASGVLINVPHPHHKLHQGNRFYVMYSVASLGAMTSPDDMITLDFTTPDTAEWGHFVFTAKGTSGWRVRLIEGPSGGAASPTDQLTILNHNRNSSNASVMSDGSTVNQVNRDGTLATGGTTLWDEYIFGSTQGQTGTGIIAIRDELLLKQNTKYQLSLFGTDTDPAMLLMDWYEHANK